MDSIDRQIVALLRQNARRSFQSIGMRVSLSAPAVKRRVDRLEADGVIRGYTAQVDPGRYGWGTHAIVALYTEGRMAATEVREAVERHPEVEAAYTVAGEASAVLHVRARDTAHLEEALERLRDHAGVTRTQTQIVLSTLFERPFEEPPTAYGGLTPLPRPRVTGSDPLSAVGWSWWPIVPWDSRSRPGWWRIMPGGGFRSEPPAQPTRR
jgi:DNA-binding Lrp family transcriptional regulator